MIEHFTQASCGPCASQNPAMQATLAGYSGDYVKISHQVSWPGTDPMNAAYPAGPDVRRNYYGVSGVPNTTLNGGSPGAPNTIVTNSTLTSAAQNMTPYDITVTQSWPDANTIDVTVEVTNTTGSAVSDADKIFITMYEETVDYGTAPGSNGETVFYNVMRQMYTTTGSTSSAEAGSNLPTIAGGATETYNFTISSLPSYLFDKAEVRFAVYLENESAKTIHQAAKSDYAPIPGIVAVSAASASQAGTGLCDYAFTPGVEFTNNDSQTAITEIVAEYSIDGGTPVQETVSGINLTQGQTETITFPATTLNPGTSVVSYTIVSANGSQPWSSPQAVAIPDETYNKLNATGVAAPVMETMESAPLEAGTGYSRDLTTAIFSADAAITSASFGVLDGPSYNYGAIGGYGNSNRAIRVRFYSIQSGTMDLTMQKINTGNNTALTFDHTYCQYQAENDQMTVYVSTDCGATWTQVWQAAGSALATLPANTTQYNAPAAGDWTTTNVDLSAYDNMSDVVVRMEFVSAYGNNLFLDNINVAENNSINEEEQIAVSIFPNPATDNFTVKLDESANGSIQVVDVQGKVVASQNVTGQAETTVDASALAAGIYTVLVSTENGVATKKVVVE
ncbi:MAG: hypothetical protein Crog4KO_30000 [Crocinitomicaceae bacterium]